MLTTCLDVLIAGWIEVGVAAEVVAVLARVLVGVVAAASAVVVDVPAPVAAVVVAAALVVAAVVAVAFGTVAVVAVGVGGAVVVAGGLCFLFVFLCFHVAVFAEDRFRSILGLKTAEKLGQAVCLDRFSQVPPVKRGETLFESVVVEGSRPEQAN